MMSDKKNSDEGIALACFAFAWFCLMMLLQFGGG